MDLLQAIRLDALAGVLLDAKRDEFTEDDRRRFLRKIFRWYSREFSTPLHVVERLPLVDILVHYYEDRAENLSEEDLDAERRLLTETEAERRARLTASDPDEVGTEAFLQQIEAEEAARMAAEKKRGPNLPEPQRRGAMLGDAGDRPAPAVTAMASRESELPDPVAAPDFKVEFASDEDFANELEGLGSMDQPPKKR
jgi:hypothetical protein